jgi:hypothetical protein
MLLMNRARLIAAILPFAVFFAFVGAVHAEEPTIPGVLGPMADGSYYHPASDLHAPTLRHMREALGLAPVETPAVETPAVAEPVPSPVPSSGDTQIVFTLRNAISRAREAFAKKIAEQEAAKEKIRVVTSYDVWVDVTLAVWNPATDEISYVDLSKNGTKVKMESEATQLSVSVRKNNGVNSEFAVAGAEGARVVAVKYPIFKSVGTARRPKYELHDVVYVPYSSAIHEESTVSWGRERLDATMAAVYAELRAAGTRSRAYPDRLMADVVDPDWVRSIAMIEHLGMNALEADTRRAMDSVYVILGTNQEDAYAYSRSSAGAFGLVQFIPSTYKLMTRRTDLGLIVDFETGMRNHHNAIKASVGYLDAELASMPLAVKDLYYVDEARVGEYLAAAYNGGGGRVRKAIRSFGDGWSEDGAKKIEEMRAERRQVLDRIAALKAKAKKVDAKALKTVKADLSKAEARNKQLFDAIELAKVSKLRAETAEYVMKYRAVMKLLKPPPIPTLVSAS